MNIMKNIIRHQTKILLIFAFLTITSCALLNPQNYIEYRLSGNSVIVKSKLGEIKYTALSNEAIEIQNLKSIDTQLPSFSIQQKLAPRIFDIKESYESLTLTTGKLSAVIKKDDLSVSFFRESEFLVKQLNDFKKKNKVGFNFKLDSDEKIMGGGERVLGMDRRGHRMPLYNRAHYGYTTKSNQMYYSVPYIISSKKYSILFDNSASGFLDIAKTEKNTLTFESLGGRSSYIVFSGDTYPKLINSYVNVTGKQPLPPRWALGSFASRFGYRTEQQVRQTVSRYIEEDIPLDAIILDLYWFGKDIKGYMGNLDWDYNTFPTPIKMMSDLKQKGIKTVLVTEPFILSSSKKWQESVDKKILVKNEKGEAKRFDFYFGNTGLIDVFDSNGQNWFTGVYEMLSKQGVAGIWGDLGEPEVHPDDALHFVSSIQKEVRADILHNVYGHQWAKVVYENQLKLQPNTRPFIMMRSGFAGSQRFGMIPWTGDVSRSWDGLKPQVELSLQMGLSGLAYTHSDLGGFAGGDTFNKELYIRWLQYGVFQPIFRPHAQDNIAPEPVYHDKQTKDILRKFIKLRYQLLPYIYTLAYENSTTGMPLMRPVFFEDADFLERIDVKDSYFWGDAFLVSPITTPNTKIHTMDLPEGVWFNYWDETSMLGGKSVQIPVTLDTLPVVVRAGAFIPMVDSINNTQDYSSQKLTLHYYADKSILESSGHMYEDNGTTFDSIGKKEFELLKFSSTQSSNDLKIKFTRETSGYRGMPMNRELKLVVHNWHLPPEKISFAGRSISTKQYTYDETKNILTINTNWEHQPAELKIELWLGN